MHPTNQPNPSPVVIRVIHKRLAKWGSRHQHPFNFAIHMFAVPLSFFGVLKWFDGEWYLGTLLFVTGYLLQFVGHLVEGNDIGEWALIKWGLGWPRVPISPRWLAPDRQMAQRS